MVEAAESDLDRRISLYPVEALGFFQNGFIIAEHVAAAEWDALIDQLINIFARGRRQIKGSDIKIEEISGQDAAQIASIVSLVIGLLSDSKANLEQFERVAEGRLFRAEQRDAAALLVTSICSRRADIEKNVAKAQLAGVVLPSLDAFDITVDLRLRIIDGKVSVCVPVAVAHLDTDGQGERIWFQMSQADVEELAEKLNKTLEKMDVASKIQAVY